MKMLIAGNKVVVAACLAAFCFGVYAAAPQGVSWNWSASPTQGASVTNAFSWFDGTNWNGDPVDSASLKADFTGGPAAARYVKVDKDVTVADIEATVSGTFTTNSTQKLVVISDHDFIIDRTGDISATTPHGVVLYADVSWMKTTYPKSVILCGEVASAAGANTSLGIAYNYPMEIRDDLFAGSSSEDRPNAFGVKYVTLNAGDVTLVAPHGSAVPVVGKWSQTEGSPYLFRTGAAHVLCAGTVVSGDGVQNGSFVKRIFSDGVIELSKPVTATVAENVLTFAAFRPRVAQTLELTSGQDGNHNFRVMKWDDVTDFRLTLSMFKNTKPNSVYVFDVKEGALPGTIVIQRANEMAGKVQLGKCRLEFAANIAGLTAAADVSQPSASAVSYLAATNGISARIANVSKLSGTVVKEGVGDVTLELTGSAANYTGSFVVCAGGLFLEAAEELTVASLAISNGATLHVPECGIRCGSLHVQPGAVVSGPGALTVADFSEDLLDVTCTDEAKVLYEDLVHHGDVFIEPPPTNVPGNPAVWFDAARLDSFDYSEDNEGVNRINTWTDVRGAGYMTATYTCETKKPELVVTTDGQRNFVSFKEDRTVGAVAQSYELGWARKVSGICSIFKVVGCLKGGGQFLGRCELRRNAEYRTFSNPVFIDSLVNGIASPDKTRFYINGMRRDWTTGYAYPGAVNAYEPGVRVPQVAEFHLDVDTVSAQGFSAQEDTALGRNGNQDLYELIVYTNRLTEAERLAVSGYLMKKWLDAKVEYETVVDVARLSVLPAGKYVGLAEGTKMAADTVEGEGSVIKDGDGTLYVADCVTSETAFEIRGGSVCVRSVLPVAESLPAGAVLHLDASNSETYLGTQTSGGNTYLTEWGDVRGSGSVKVTTPTATATSHPKVVPAKQNGLPMVDFGPFGNGYPNVDMNGAKMSVRSVFVVMNSENGGGYLLGDTECSYCNTAQPDGYHGLVRNPVGTLAYPILQYSSATVTHSGPGATQTRLNGASVNGNAAYFTGTNDLVSVRTFERVPGNSITTAGVGGALYRGGKMIGELIYYSDRLTEEESGLVEAYLNKKWFNKETVLYRQAKLAAVTVDAGATLDIVGGAPLMIGACAGSGTVNGSLQFSENAEWPVNLDVIRDSSALTVTGILDLSTVRAVVLSGTAKLAAGSYTIAKTGGIVGDVSAIALDVSAVSSRRDYALRQVGDDLVLEVSPQGIMLIVR